jgi:hypothetical protein
LRQLDWVSAAVLGLSLATGTDARAACENEARARLSAAASETADYRIDVDVIPARVVDQDIRRFRPELWPGLAYTAYGLTSKATGARSTVLVEADGDRDSTVLALDQVDDRGKTLIFVAVQREKPTVGATDGQWLTTYLFRAEPFALLWESDGFALTATAADQKPLPPMQPPFAARFMVLCFPGNGDGPGDGDGPPEFGLIDRTLLYGLK